MSIPSPIRLFLLNLSIALPLLSATQSSGETASSHIPSLAVNNLSAHGLTESEALTLSDVLRSRLMETKKFKVMERSEMEMILKEQSFQQGGACNEEACMVEMGQLLGIEQLLAGSIGKVGKAFSINVRIISVQSGEIIYSVSHNYTGPIESLLTSEINVVAKKIAGIPLAIEPRPEAVPEKKRGNKLRRGVILCSVAVLAAGGGVAAFFLLRNDDEPEEPTSTVEVQWKF
ncbi:MAG: cell wall synthesis protein CwsA [Chitinispirillaceae bacterium]|nr:cell wall synthesis protein CwsA [Chitinispirillaceae bacterium]